MSTAERTYRLLLRAYPAAFRAAYGREMLLLFRDQRRREGAGGVGFWTALLWDVARSAPAQRLEAWRAWWSGDTRTREGTMKAMAILTVLIGAFEAVNSVAEGWLGGVLHHSAISLIGGVMGTVAGTLLVAAGVALLRRTPRAVTLARRAAAVSLTTVVFLPRMSVLAIIVAIVFPIILLLFLRRTAGRSAPMVA